MKFEKKKKMKYDLILYINIETKAVSLYERLVKLFVVVWWVLVVFCNFWLQSVQSLVVCSSGCDYFWYFVCSICEYLYYLRFFYVVCAIFCSTV